MLSKFLSNWIELIQVLLWTSLLTGLYLLTTMALSGHWTMTFADIWLEPIGWTYPDITVKMSDRISLYLMYIAFSCYTVGAILTPIAMYFVARNDRLVFPIRLFAFAEILTRFVICLYYMLLNLCELSNYWLPKKKRSQVAVNLSQKNEKKASRSERLLMTQMLVNSALTLAQTILLDVFYLIAPFLFNDNLRALFPLCMQTFRIFCFSFAAR
ncbi:unnamed protein product, partial [Mesorhabditis belari]|uniref:Uncharacterized protein n=1 Tax=Mesorhabditis belari TaxID=2138241 RepID=A0AAF3F784_9BILA